ncbi:MAG: RdgB/HAM1 family non-canonical purine NTP pyrophosphatase [Muribaculaceae bacterium]|nr:RdgB/HAM1 family non-canonical purine NTP pyrophosphatase [Muribaculaceae bacterium]
MTNRHRLVMATNNAGKLREARAIAGDRLEILSLADIGYDHDIEETADSLEGNALIKVRAIKDATGLDCFADDTGLVVDALGGAPGVHTARYAGEQCDPDANIDLLLHNLEGVSDRRARFCTCIALSLGGEEHTFEGKVEGSIATERSGLHGFGYDPIFIPEETGVCFAEMTDEAKNAISHRARALSAMMKWLSALCMVLICTIAASGASSADWRIHNTFDDQIENVFDTPSKTYFIVQAQQYQPSVEDNREKLCFLFALDKDSGELRPYNAGNFLTRSLIRKAFYNAAKNYLLIVYDDYTVDILEDDGKVRTVLGLKEYTPAFSKDIRGITFDPENDRIYLATDFGMIVIDDKKDEIAMSGIFNVQVDKVVRAAGRLFMLRDGKLLSADAESKNISLQEFTAPEWVPGGTVNDIFALSPTKILVMTTLDRQWRDYIVSFPADGGEPVLDLAGALQGGYVSENKDGLMISRSNAFVGIDRDSGSRTVLLRPEGDPGRIAGSWDMKDFYLASPREGFYSISRNSDGSWTQLSQTTRPNAPAVFRSNALKYDSRLGLLANTHGISQNFSSYDARNPILLSSLKDGQWTPYGLPYLDSETALRLINPCGFAQDPDNPDIFYFGSVKNGLLRYNIKDMSNLLHMTKSNDNPSYPGHVSLQDPYASWSNTFILLNPVFDRNGNLLLVHVNTDQEKNYFPEIWIWTPEQRRASVSPETFQPFTRLPIDEVKTGSNNIILPLHSKGFENMAVLIPLDRYNSPFVVYDHNGTPAQNSDDRQSLIKDLEDSDGKLGVHYFYCAVEDPATGLVWIGSDSGVFTFDPKDAFSNPRKVSRIKVSRNDGTSLADYLLSGTLVNHIAIDGLGRKWFSLDGGGLVCTSADGRTILQEINTDNSMLPSDIVYASCYNPDNNSMMIATSTGLAEYYLSGQAAENGSTDVRAYPNPVRHDYYGWVTIDGLEEDCIVKIADSAGNIVRELGPASAGRVQWDVCGMDLNRVPSGVYFVLASSGPGGGSYSEVTKILVINR